MSILPAKNIAQSPKSLLNCLPAPLTSATPDARAAVAELLAGLAGGAVVELEGPRLEAVALLGAPAGAVRVADGAVGAVAAVDGAVRAAGDADAGVAAVPEQAAVVHGEGGHVERRSHRRPVGGSSFINQDWRIWITLW